MTKASTNFRKNLPNAALPLANNVMNIKLVTVAATVPIANEPIYNENEETSKAIIRISLTEYCSLSWREAKFYGIPREIIFAHHICQII